MLSGSKRRPFHLLVGAILTFGTPIIGALLTKGLNAQWNWWTILGCGAAGISVTFLFLRWQARSGEESPEAIKEQVGQLHSELRSQVQTRSYGARSRLIAAPLKELDLDITPRVGLVRDPRLTEPKPISERNTDIVAAFTSSKRRLLIVGEPGSGKTTAAYALIEHLDETEGDERVPLLVNLSAWESQENFQGFLVDYLCSEVGYQVRRPAVANAFIHSRRYTLVLDGLDEIPAGLRTHFSERLDEFVRGLPSEVAVVVTCRTQEYAELFAAHPTGLGLVQAVEILPLTSQQLDAAFVELAKYDKDWETFLTQRHLTASQRARDLLSNPLFLNLAVAGQLPPRELLNSDQEQELRDLVLERYLGRVFEDRSACEPKDVRRHLTWIARFLNGLEVSPFGLKTADSTVFDLANLTPPDPPMRHRLFQALVAWLVIGLVIGLTGAVSFLVRARTLELYTLLAPGLGIGVLPGVVVGLLTGWPFKRSAVSARLTFVWPSTRQKLLDLLSTFGLRLVAGLALGLALGLIVALGFWLVLGLPMGGFWRLVVPPLEVGLGLGLGLGGVWGLLEGLTKPRSVLITSRTPKEVLSRSLVAALFGLIVGLGLGLIVALVLGLIVGLGSALRLGLIMGLGSALVLGLRNGGEFVLLQKVAQRRLRQAGRLPTRVGNFLDWGITTNMFRQVGGGVRFRHGLIQRHLASTSANAEE